MESNVNYAMVGAFVLSLLTALVIAIVWLSAGLSFTQYQTYLVYMTESVSGLSLDATVEYNGVQVGSVKNIVLNQSNPHIVEVYLNIKNGTPITRGTVATLTTRGLTGLAYIALKDNGTDLTRLTEQANQPYPVIKTAPSLFMRLDTQLNKLSNNFDKVSTSIQSLLNQENLVAIRKILNNTEKMTQSIYTTTLKLQPLLTNTNSSIQVFQTQTLPAANRTMNSFDAMSQNISDLSTEIKENPSILIRGKQPTRLGPGE